MTVSMQITKRIYQGNGVSTQWDVDFPFINVADVRVYLTSPEGVETELTAHYELDPSTHTLTYPTAESNIKPLAAGWTLTVLRNTPLTQEIDLIRQGELDAEVLEEGYDKLTLLVQELHEQVARSIKYPVSAQETNMETEQFLNHIATLKQDAAAASGQAQAAAAQAQQSAESAQTAQSQAAQFLQQTQQAQAEASQAQTETETAAAAAQAAQAAAEGAQGAAQTAQSQAAASRAAADASAAAAQNWAAQTDGPVADGTYSARYYAEQAAAGASQAEAAQGQAQAEASAAANSAASADQSAQTCQELVDTLGTPAQRDLSNVTNIAASSAVQTALNAKANANLSNGTQAAQTDINRIMPDAMDYVVDSYSDDAGNWYRWYKSGWLEQGGQLTNNSIGWHTVTFLKPFSFVCNLINTLVDAPVVSPTVDTLGPKQITNTNFMLYQTSPGANSWIAIGKGDENYV